MKIDAETGDSLWTESYGTELYLFRHEGCHPYSRFRIPGGRTVLLASSQDPRVYVMKLNSSEEQANLFLAKEDLGPEHRHRHSHQGCDRCDCLQDQYLRDMREDRFPVSPFGGRPGTDLEHDGTTVTLVDQPFHSGENFLQPALMMQRKHPWNMDLPLTVAGFSPRSLCALPPACTHGRMDPYGDRSWKRGTQSHLQGSGRMEPEPADRSERRNRP